MPLDSASIHVGLGRAQQRDDLGRARAAARGADARAEGEQRRGVLHRGGRDDDAVDGGGGGRILEPQPELVGGLRELAALDARARVHEQQLAQHALVARLVGLGASSADLLVGGVELPLLQAERRQRDAHAQPVERRRLERRQQRRDRALGDRLKAFPRE